MHILLQYTLINSQNQSINISDAIKHNLNLNRPSVHKELYIISRSQHMCQNGLAADIDKSFIILNNTIQNEDISRDDLALTCRQPTP